MWAERKLTLLIRTPVYLQPARALSSCHDSRFTIHDRFVPTLLYRIGYGIVLYSSWSYLSTRARSGLFRDQIIKFKADHYFSQCSTPPNGVKDKRHHVVWTI